MLSWQNHNCPADDDGSCYSLLWGESAHCGMKVSEMVVPAPTEKEGRVFLHLFWMHRCCSVKKRQLLVFGMSGSFLMFGYWIVAASRC